jgi:hypothetical protein
MLDAAEAASLTTITNLMARHLYTSPNQIWPIPPPGSIHDARYVEVDEFGNYKQNDSPIPLDPTFMLINTSAYTESTSALYSNNRFYFCEASFCLWWLKTIGVKNFAKVRTLTLSLGSGFLVDHPYRGPMHLSQEEMWCQVLGWMMYRHRLVNLTIQFSRWTELVANRKLANEERPMVDNARSRIMGLLRGFRGVKHVHLLNHECYWVTEKEAAKMNLMMAQPRSTDPRIAIKSVNLLHVMDSLRNNREQEEAVERETARVAAEATQQQYDDNYTLANLIDDVEAEALSGQPQEGKVYVSATATATQAGLWWERDREEENKKKMRNKKTNPVTYGSKRSCLKGGSSQRAGGPLDDSVFFQKWY